MATLKFHLLIIDPQNDFCDLPDDYRPVLPGGSLAPSLPVTGAHADMLRVADLIRRGGAGLSDISVTLDSHQHLDIAHTTFWQKADGSPMAPFTQVTAADVRAGTYRPRDPVAAVRTLHYLDALEAAGRYTHMVWPVHCEIGSWGHNVHHDVRLAYNAWEELTGRTVNKVVKGTNPWTEHYSAIRAEVPVEGDESTQLNAALIAGLERADRIFITGEAGSHCVKATTEHIVECFAPQERDKLVLVTDCMSAVGGFEAEYEHFINDMLARGVQVASSTEAIAALLANA